jgi:hypothetical protein
MKELQARSTRAAEMALSAAGDAPAPPAGARLGTQISVLTSRGALLAVRNPQALAFIAIQNLVFGIIIGSLYSNLGNFAAKAVRCGAGRPACINAHVPVCAVHGHGDHPRHGGWRGSGDGR